MRNQRCRYLKSKIKNKDEKTIETIRSEVGKKAVLMKDFQLYRWAKKLWGRGKLKK